MKVLSYNVLCYGCEGHNWFDRKDDVLENVRMRNPDIFGLQEAHYDWMKAFIAGMPDYDHVGVGRDDGKTDGEFSPVFYKREQFDLLDKGWFWISETPDVPSLGFDSACIRICSYAILRDRATGKEFAAMDVHLDHVGVIARQKGVEMINEKAAALGCPALVMGDFNIPEKTDCYIDMLKPGLFEDSKFLAPYLENSYTFHPYFHHPKEAYEVIDYIFVTKEFKVTNYHVGRNTLHGAIPSDHAPVIVDLVL